MSDVGDATLSAETIQSMVDRLQPDWTVTSIDRMAEGTDYVAALVVETPSDERETVLKATTADLVAPAQARCEPRMIELVDRETTIPVPEVYGYCDDHDEYPAPFYLMGAVDGENFEGRHERLEGEVRVRLCRDAGRYLGELTSLGPLPAVGTVGVADGDLRVLDDDDHSRYSDQRRAAIDGVDSVLDALLDGGHFPEMARDRERFADLVPDLRAYLHETLPSLPDPDPPTYSHRDYRYGNLLLDPETGETNAVLDWAGTMSTEPAYTIANTESLLFDPIAEDDDLVARLRSALREGYTETREDWTFDAETRERLDAYLLTNRIDLMAIFPLVYRDATDAERDRREADHREFVQRYL